MAEVGRAWALARERDVPDGKKTGSSCGDECSRRSLWRAGAAHRGRLADAQRAVRQYPHSDGHDRREGGCSRAFDGACAASSRLGQNAQRRARLTRSLTTRGELMPVLAVDGAEIYYEVHGNGPPMLLISGTACDGAFWTPHQV